MGRVTIDFDSAGEQLTGSLVAGSGPPRAFAGWLELMSRLEEVAATLSEGDADPAQESRREETQC
jgi:hypothetical protein